jgi:plastocyanin
MSKIALARLLAAPLLLAAVVMAADHNIQQKDRKFSETELSIKPGDSISFENQDDVAHNVFSATPGLEFEIHRQNPGEKSTIQFAKEGTVEVRCSIHPRMKLLVTVKK